MNTFLVLNDYREIAHPITNPTFNLYFNIPSQLENPLYVHIPNGLFYKVLFHIVSNWDRHLHFMSQFM